MITLDSILDVLSGVIFSGVLIIVGWWVAYFIIKFVEGFKE